jgi:hypothetical protein
MATERATLTLPLSRAEQAELLDYVPASSISLRTDGLAPGELGDPATAIAIVSLSMVAITGICAWLASRGRGVSVTVNASAPGGFSAGFSITLTEQSKPEAVRAQLAAKGIDVPDT